MAKGKSNKKRSTEALIEELKEFHHYEAAGRLAHFQRLLAGRCEVCGRTDCERMK